MVKQKEIPKGLEVLRMVDYNGKTERWTRELWLELGEIIDGCCEEHDGCENCNGCRGECNRRLASDMCTNPRKWGYREKADAHSSGAGCKDKPDSTGDWMSAGKLPNFKEMPVLRY